MQKSASPASEAEAGRSGSDHVGSPRLRHGEVPLVRGDGASLGGLRELLFPVTRPVSAHQVALAMLFEVRGSALFEPFELGSLLGEVRRW